MGVDRTRVSRLYRALVYELLNWRDAQRELKALIKAADYRGWGVLRLNAHQSVLGQRARRIFGAAPGRGRTPHDATALSDNLIARWCRWKETLQDLESTFELNVSGLDLCSPEFQRIPGVVDPGATAHVFSAEH